ncbi:MAG: gas vesicle protein GvpJ [Thermoanaerobaculia bacterium]
MNDNETRDLTLLDTLDHLLDRGVVISGQAIVSIGDIDLLYLGLNVVLASVDTITGNRKKPPQIDSRDADEKS